MTFNNEQIEALKAPLGSSHVKSRSQAGRSLSYIEGWWAIAEANRIFGFDAWDRETMELRQLGEPREVDGKWRVAYMARVRITVRAGGFSSAKDTLDPQCDIVRDGTGYGSGIDKDLGQAHESAIKEAETDAMKRALMTFGNPFGLALYDKDQTNVVDENGPAAIAATLKKTLAMAQTESDLEIWKKHHAKTINGLPPEYRDDVIAAGAAHRTALQNQHAEAA